MEQQVKSHEKLMEAVRAHRALKGARQALVDIKEQSPEIWEIMVKKYPELTKLQ